MKIHNVLALAFMISLGSAAYMFSQEPATRPIKSFMQLKLDPAKQILEGIATENFDLIDRSAQRISALTFDESWMTLQTNDYRQHSRDFQKSIETISQAARNKNLDAATLGYMQMTLYCVQCHRSLRH